MVTTDPKQLAEKVLTQEGRKELLDWVENLYKQTGDGLMVARFGVSIMQAQNLLFQQYQEAGGKHPSVMTLIDELRFGLTALQVGFVELIDRISGELHDPIKGKQAEMPNQ